MATIEETTQLRLEKAVGDGVEEKHFVWKEDLHVADCTVKKGATLIFRSDGTVSWIAEGRSTQANDTLYAGFDFLKADGSIDLGSPLPGIPTMVFQTSPCKLNMPNKKQWYPWLEDYTFYSQYYATAAKVTLRLSAGTSPDTICTVYIDSIKQPIVY